MSEWFQENDKDIVNYIGMVEFFCRDMKEIARINKIPEHYLKILNLNQTHRYDYRQMYTQNTKKIVEDRFADVIERFNYKF